MQKYKRETADSDVVDVVASKRQSIEALLRPVEGMAKSRGHSRGMRQSRPCHSSRASLSAQLQYSLPADFQFDAFGNMRWSWSMRASSIRQANLDASAMI
jgi:hypothetical protein